MYDEYDPQAQLANLIKLMDKIADRCGFDKWDWQRSESEKRMNALYHRWLQQAAQLEQELGL